MSSRHAKGDLQDDCPYGVANTLAIIRDHVVVRYPLGSAQQSLGDD